MKSNSAFAFGDDFESVATGGGVSVFIKPAFLKVGDVIQGVLDEVRDEVGKYKKPTAFITLTAPLTYGDNKNAEKTYAAGDRIAINLRGNLMANMIRAGVEAGDSFAIRYDGKSEIKSGEHKGSESHNFSVGKRRKPAAAPERLPE